MTKTKFERDKVYKTRDGQYDERVICTDAPERGAAGPLVCLDQKGGVSRRYTDGRLLKDEDSSLDLVLPKPEPIVEWGAMSTDGRHFIRCETRVQALALIADAHAPSELSLAKRTTEIVED